MATPVRGRRALFFSISDGIWSHRCGRWGSGQSRAGCIGPTNSLTLGANRSSSPHTNRSGVTVAAHARRTHKLPPGLSMKSGNCARAASAWNCEMKHKKNTIRNAALYCRKARSR